MTNGVTQLLDLLLDVAKLAPDLATAQRQWQREQQQRKRDTDRDIDSAGAERPRQRQRWNDADTDTDTHTDTDTDRVSAHSHTNVPKPLTRTQLLRMRMLREWRAKQWLVLPVCGISVLFLLVCVLHLRRKRRLYRPWRQMRDSVRD